MARRAPLQLGALATAIAVSCAAPPDSAGPAPANASRRAGFVASSRPFLGSLGGLRGGVLPGEEQGALWIDEDGTPTKYYLPGANVIDGGRTVEYRPPHRFYLMKRPTTEYANADNFYKVQLVGKTFTVDMDLSGAGCGCNVNFYLVDMPVAGAGKDGDYYCDAQCFEGMGCCAEFDMNEGNAHVQQVTNHACTADYQDHSDWRCHKWGQPEDKTHTWQFGVGSSSVIDSSRPFTFSQEFRMEGDQLRVTTTLSQGDKRVVLQMGPDPQLQAMMTRGSLEKGMAFVTGYWHAPDMNWLDGDACGQGEERCSELPARISNWRITTNGRPVPPSPPSPAPAPTPAPEPTPVPGEGNSCCWHACGSCSKSGEWCAQKDRCAKNCGGKWLTC